jgi:hypothetical protein
MSKLSVKETVELLSSKRVTLDVAIAKVNMLPRSRPTSLSATALQLGRMYLGEICMDLGKEYPYEKTKEATTAKGIQEATDTSNKKVTVDDNEIIELNKLRELLGQVNDDILEVVNNCIKANPMEGLSKFKNDCNVSQAYRSLKEGRMWLGVRLGEIRDKA